MQKKFVEKLQKPKKEKTFKVELHFIDRYPKLIKKLKFGMDILYFDKRKVFFDFLFLTIHKNLLNIC